MRLLERSGVDVYGDFARSVEDWAIRTRHHIEGVMIDEEQGFVMIAESHEERLDREAKAQRRRIRNWYRASGQYFSVGFNWRPLGMVYECNIIDDPSPPDDHISALSYAIESIRSREDAPFTCILPQPTIREWRADE